MIEIQNYHEWKLVSAFDGSVLQPMPLLCAVSCIPPLSIRTTILFTADSTTNQEKDLTFDTNIFGRIWNDLI
jgi:hypothetical protein